MRKFRARLEKAMAMRYEILGRRVEVEFDGEGEFYPGMIRDVKASLHATGEDKRLHFVVYDDNDKKCIDVSADEEVGELRWLGSSNKRKILTESPEEKKQKQKPVTKAETPAKPSASSSTPSKPTPVKQIQPKPASAKPSPIMQTSNPPVPEPKALVAPIVPTTTTSTINLSSLTSIGAIIRYMDRIEQGKN